MILRIGRQPFFSFADKTKKFLAKNCFPTKIPIMRFFAEKTHKEKNGLFIISNRFCQVGSLFNKIPKILKPINKVSFNFFGVT